MCNQNIISNKFDLKLVTTFSSYWCTAIFTKSRSLHYVLKKQRKSISSEPYWRKERCFPNDTQKQRRQKKNDAHNSQSMARISESKCRMDDTQGRNDASRNRKMTHRNKRQQHFPEWHPEKWRKQRRLQKFTDHSKDLKNHRSLNKRI